jgi:hypothetical protein
VEEEALQKLQGFKSIELTDFKVPLISRRKGEKVPKRRIQPISNGHMRPWGRMRCPDGGGDRKDGGRGDDNPTIGTFAGYRMDVVRGSSPDDGEYAKCLRVVSVRELRRIRDGIAASEMTRAYALVMGKRVRGLRRAD